MKPLVLLFLLVLVACQGPRRSVTWTGAPPPTAQADDEDDTAPPRPPRDVPPLTLLDRNDHPDPSVLPPGLTGENKPGSPVLRFRRSVPEATPASIARDLGGLELFIAEAIPEGWLAFYKGQCGTLGDVCQYRARLHDADGNVRWDLGLNRFLEQPRYVEIQDVRYRNGALFFNEACATYSAEAGGQCSSLVRLDPVFEEVAWRTPPLTSNNLFIFHDRWIVAGYGFTGEPDALFLIDARTGEIAARADLDAAHQYLEVDDDVLYVLTYRSLYQFAL